MSGSDTKEQAVAVQDDVIQKDRKTFCGCCSLKTGTLSCGIFCLVFSTFVIVSNGTYMYYPNHYHMDTNILLKAVIGFITSVFCIHGAVKESRYSLVPWLIATAIFITMSFLTGFYFILYGCFEIVMLGLIIIASCGLLTYCWTCVANYYTELRDRAHVHNTDHASARSYIDPSAVTSPDAFTSPPPPSYSVVVVEEKPPCYEEAEKMQKV